MGLGKVLSFVCKRRTRSCTLSHMCRVPQILLLGVTTVMDVGVATHRLGQGTCTLELDNTSLFDRPSSRRAVFGCLEQRMGGRKSWGMGRSRMINLSSGISLKWRLRPGCCQRRNVRMFLEGKSEVQCLRGSKKRKTDQAEKGKVRDKEEVSLDEPQGRRARSIAHCLKCRTHVCLAGAQVPGRVSLGKRNRSHRTRFMMERRMPIEGGRVIKWPSQVNRILAFRAPRFRAGEAVCLPTADRER
ncbi:hypothetical protein OF83DRAFT_871160 [Amylostereum chailletii]|nr:hypothetical protein OF83DRAFT_871160 [Amylostereum chailletii]